MVSNELQNTVEKILKENKESNTYDEQPNTLNKKVNFDEENEDSLKCVACNNFIKNEDELKENKIILWSTDCFHMTHKDCFLSHLFKLAKNG